MRLLAPDRLRPVPPGDHLLRVITVVGVLFGTGGVSLLRFGWWGPAAAVLALALVVLLVGAFVLFDREAQLADAYAQLNSGMQAMQEKCFEHIAAVERFLKVQALKAPARPPDLLAALEEIGTEQAALRREVAWQDERETVAGFMETDLLDRGVWLFDWLVAEGCIVDTTRPYVADPKTVHQIEEGLDSIRTAAERLPVLR